MIALINIQQMQQKLLQKTAEATGDLIVNKIADKIARVSKKKSTKELHDNDKTEEDTEITTHKERCISPEERQQIVDELRLVPKKDEYF